MFSDFYHTSYYLLLIIGVFVSLVFISKISRPYKVLCVLIVVTFVSELLAKYVSFTLKSNHNIVYHFFVVIEYGFYCLIFHYLFKNIIASRILLSSFIFLLGAEVLNTIYLQSIKRSNTNILILEAIFLVVCSLFLFKKQREKINYKSVLLEPVFWFSSAILVYYSFNTLIWGIHSMKVYNLQRPPIIIYDINLLLSGMLYLIFSVVALLDFRRIKNGLV